MQYFSVFRLLSSHIGGGWAGLVLLLLISLPTLALLGIFLLGGHGRTWRKPITGHTNRLKFVLTVVLVVPLIPPLSLFAVTFCVIRFAGDFFPDALLIWYLANTPGLLYLLVLALTSRTALSMPSSPAKLTLFQSIRGAVPVALAIALFPPFNFLYFARVMALIKNVFLKNVFL